MSKKIVPRKYPDPVVVSDRRFEAVAGVVPGVFNEAAGVVAVYDNDSDTLLQTVKVFEQDCSQHDMEADKQLEYISQLLLKDKNILAVVSNFGRQFTLHPTTLAVMNE